jgi:hypothetical protein
MISPVSINVGNATLPSGMARAMRVLAGSVRPRTAAMGIGIGISVAVLVTLTRFGKPVDAWCYYGFDATNPWNPDGCFLYSPPVAMVMDAVRGVMSFEVFTFLLRSAELAVLIAVAGPAVGLALFIPAVAIELNAANINLLIVGAVLISFRWPWAWAFIALTKVTPGIGMLWFAARREWRNFSIALGATLAIAIASLIVAPGLWQQYLAGLGAEPDGSIWQIWWRLPLAALVVVWGARGNHRWALMIAVLLAMPRWYYLSPVLLVGLFALVRLPRPLPWVGWLAGQGMRTGRVPALGLGRSRP